MNPKFSDRTKIIFAAVALIVIALGGLIYHWRNINLIQRIQPGNISGKQAYFESYLFDDLSAQLRGYVTVGENADRETHLEMLREVEDSLRQDRSRAQLFVDDTLGQILLQSDPTNVGKTNLEVFGEAGQEAFYKLKDLTFRKPNEVVSDNYTVKANQAGERIGVYTYNTDRGLIYGLVLKDSFFAKIREATYERIIKAAVWIVVAFLLFSSYFLFKLFRYKSSALRRLTALDHTETAVAFLDEDSVVTWVNKTFRDWFKDAYLGESMKAQSKYPNFDRKFFECLQEGHSMYKHSQEIDGKQRMLSITLTRYSDTAIGGKEVIVNISDVTDLIHRYEIFSHDLTQPLTTPRAKTYALITALDRNGRSVEGKELLQKLNEIHSGITAAESYAKSLHAWARLESGSSGTYLGEIDVKEMVGKLMRHFTPTFNSLGIDFTYSIDHLLRIEDDKRDFETVIRNLLSNAINAVESQASPKIRLTISQNHEYLKIRMLDNGKGMTEREKNSVFKTNTPFKGLGTNVISKFANSRGGEVKVEYSDAQLGTEISLLIPV